MKLFVNGEFVACDENNTTFSVMGVDAGKIVYTGDSVPENLKQTELFDLNGKCVVPGFADTHIHFAAFAFFKAGLDVRDAGNLDELGDVIRRHRAKNPGEKRILGFGCSAHLLKEKRLPNAADLDRITDVPVMIVKYDGHAAVVNSAMLGKLPRKVTAVAGFNKKSGWLHQEAFYRAADWISKSISLPKLVSNLIEAGNYMARNGVSMIHTAEGVGYPLDLDVDTMRAAARALPQDFRIFFQTMDLKKVLRRKLPCVGGCFTTALDGCFGSVDAALKQPYLNSPENKGVLFYPQAAVNAFVTEANRKGLQVALHAIGDAAIDQALTAFETALKDHPRKEHRHIIIHADLMTGDLIERARDTGIAIALQTPFLYWPEEPVSYLETLLGDRRVTHMLPLKTMLNQGILMANGSDGPTTRPDPIHAIHSACNHPLESQRIPVMDALKMSTVNGAKLSFEEEIRGTLSLGKLADFVILSKPIHRVAPEEIKNIVVEETWLKGEKFEPMKPNAIAFVLRALRNPK